DRAARSKTATPDFLNRGSQVQVLPGSPVHDARGRLSGAASANMGNGVWRALVVLHRYLGVAVGLVMTMWFVSGIVMMYVGFPQLQEAERLRVQAPVPWQECCRFGERLVSDDQAILRAQVEAHSGGPALRLRRAGQPDALVDLARGSVISIDADVAKSV